MSGWLARLAPDVRLVIRDVDLETHGLGRPAVRIDRLNAEFLAEDDGWLQLTCPDRVEWWDPPHTYDGAWLRHDGDLWVVAVHHDGHLYLSSSEH